MSIKRFIPCIYLYDKMAVKSFSDTTVVSTDPVELAKYYSNTGSDAIIMMDLSGNDEEHEAALDVIKDVCSAVDIPVIGAGNVKRMEDIKKLLYAGCTQAMLNYSKGSNVEITEEVSKKFGKDKIVACVTNLVELEDNSDLLKEYVSGILFMTATSIRDALKESPVPVLALLPELSLDKLLDIASNDNLYGVCGDIVSENADSIQSMKTVFEDNGIETTKVKVNFKWEDFKLNSDGMLTVVVQDVKTDEVLMVAYMDEEAYNMTINTGRMTYHSRSRDELWVKGDTSGHYQYVQSLYVDCDADTLLAKVTQIGAACHTGNKSCFYTPIFEKEIKAEDNPLKVFEEVFDVIKDRKVNPKEGSYTNYLFDKGIDKILKKLGEEATEIVIAAKNPNENEVKYEISDFLYHMMVLMVEKNVSWEDITEELAKR